VEREDVMAKTPILGRGPGGIQPFVQTMHWGYPVTFGDTVETTYVITKLIE